MSGCKTTHISFALLLIHLTLTALWATSKDDTPYEIGMRLRQTGAYEKALPYFLAVASEASHLESHEDKLLRTNARYMAALCCEDLGDLLRAFSWHQEALKADETFEPSKLRLFQINILSLLPPEILISLIKYLDLPSLFSFARTSHYAHDLYVDALTTTDFLTDPYPFAQTLLHTFCDAQFEPKPAHIKLQRVAGVPRGDITVSFRDPQHLRKIVTRTPKIITTPPGRVLFQKKPGAKDYEELGSSLGLNVHHTYFFNIVGTTPITMTGSINTPFAVQLPKGSKSISLPLMVSGGFIPIMNAELRVQENGFALADMLETDTTLLRDIRTRDARQLFEERKESRTSNPSLYPSFETCCPSALLYHTDPLSFVSFDHLYATDPLIYCARSRTELDAFIGNNPELYVNDHGYFIDEAFEKPKLYCQGPLTVRKAFLIQTKGDLICLGKVTLPDHSLVFIASREQYFLGAQVTALEVRHVSSLCFQSSDLFHPDQKPEEMSQALWSRLTNLPDTPMATHFSL